MDIFAKIAAGEIPSYKVAENEEFYAFLDINPLVKGHTLVIPRREVDYFFDMEDDELARYQQFAKRVATAIKKAFPCRKVAQVVLGLEVAHAHIHLIPMQSEADFCKDTERIRISLTVRNYKMPMQDYLCRHLFLLSLLGEYPAQNRKLNDDAYTHYKDGDNQFMHTQPQEETKQ